MKIKGSQLKVGHVLAAEAYAPLRVVTSIHQDVIKTYPIGPMPVPPPWPAGPQPAQLATDDFTFELDDSLFTPAQLHADALLDLVRRSLTAVVVRNDWKREVANVIDRIDPPKPVTLDEALAALVNAAKWANLDPDSLDGYDRLAADASEKVLGELKARAIRAGQLK